MITDLIGDLEKALEKLKELSDSTQKDFSEHNIKKAIKWLKDLNKLYGN